jgi:hypothetical protein
MPVLRVDEGFRDLCSKLADDEYAKLKASIQEEGVRDAVVYWNNGDKYPPILDGYNRVKICVDLGIKYPMKGMKLPNRRAAECWILRNQLGRRNVTEVQRAVLLKELAERIAAEKARSHKHSPQSSGITVIPLNMVDSSSNTRGDKRLRETVAREAGVSEATVMRALATEPALEELRQKAPWIAQEALAGTLNGKHVRKLAILKPELLQPLAGLHGRELRKNVKLLLHRRALLRPVGEKFHILRESVDKCVRLNAECKDGYGGDEHWNAIKGWLAKISWEIWEWSQEAADTLPARRPTKKSPGDGLPTP